MLIKTTLIAAIAAIGLTGAAMAGGSKAPTILDDDELGAVVAGNHPSGTTLTTWTPIRGDILISQDLGYGVGALDDALGTAGDASGAIDVSGAVSIFGQEAWGFPGIVFEVAN